MALSATHYPERGLTLGILYGSTFTIERDMLMKLQSVNFEAAHPLLLPIMFAELELFRHNQLVESSVNEVETKIFELNFQSSNERQYSRTEIEKRSIAKRTSWLELTYLRNSISTWSTQLLKIAEHAVALNLELYTTANSITSLAADLTNSHSRCACMGMHMDHCTVPLRTEGPSRLLEREGTKQQSVSRNNPPQGLSRPREWSERLNTVSYDEDCIDVTWNYEDPNLTGKQMYEVGEKIKRRTAAIRDEYDEKIRDCTMRVDGMAMATQWVGQHNSRELHLVDPYIVSE